MQTTYEAKQGFWHRGEWIEPGRTLPLTEREARYHVLNGELTPLQTTVEGSEKPASEPKKRGK